MAAAPTSDDHHGYLRERALANVVTNLAIAPFWLVPFTVLVSVLTRGDNDHLRLQVWIAAAFLSSVLIGTSITTYRRRRPGPTPRATLALLRAAMVSMSGSISHSNTRPAERISIALTSASRSPSSSVPSASAVR